jgi:hypothetical protein
MVDDEEFEHVDPDPNTAGGATKRSCDNEYDEISIFKELTAANPDIPDLPDDKLTTESTWFRLQFNKYKINKQKRLNANHEWMNGRG